ncbi:MAG: sulfurtransferase complex subunit TusD [Pseudomonadales bacterium]|nr:sulfurtransferase complex subunit TusD [Pseudomonadales bacterium]
MKFSILVTCPPQAQGAQSALKFAKASLNAGHELHRIFFYQDAVNLASTLQIIPRDEYNLNDEWSAFIAEYKLDAVVCIAAAVRRGVLDENEAKRYNTQGYNLSPQFELSGLGQLVDAMIVSDRMITFK